MLRKNRGKLIVTSLVILLPGLLGLLLWELLPETMPTHWSFAGEIDGWSSRALAVLGLPALMLGFHWLCAFFTLRDPRNQAQSGKVFGLVLWICPLVSLFSNAMMYAAALDRELHADQIAFLLLGLMFAVLGNYLPKCRQNATIGVKVKWTLQNEENWNATHRFTGRCWLVGGILLMLCAFLPLEAAVWGIVVLLTVLSLLPILYSYLFYRRQRKSGTALFTPMPGSRRSKKATAIMLCIAAVIVVFSIALLFTGNIHISFQEDVFTVKASYWSGYTVRYVEIEQVEYRDADDVGIRSFGLGSMRLLAGAFRNDEFGSYTRYSYTGCDACVVLTLTDETLVLNGADEAQTEALYAQLLQRAA